jgi:hypothetical protein
MHFTPQALSGHIVERRRMTSQRGPRIISDSSSHIKISSISNYLQHRVERLLPRKSPVHVPQMYGRKLTIVALYILFETDFRVTMRLALQVQYSTYSYSKKKQIWIFPAAPSNPAGFLFGYIFLLVDKFVLWLRLYGVLLESASLYAGYMWTCPALHHSASSSYSLYV